MAARMPATIIPLYRAPMTLPPSDVLTKNVPMIDATIETAPRTSGYKTASMPYESTTRLPSSIVAMMVTA